MTEQQPEAALGRVAKLAETWAAMHRSGGVAAEVDAHCGRLLLDVIHGACSAEVRLSRVAALAESWIAPGGLGLFFPAAGQAVLDAIEGESGAAPDWQARAEAAEAKLDAVYEYCQTYRGDEGMTLACEDILAITGTGEEARDG